MEIRDANDLLRPGYLDMESGYTRLSDGQLHVAAWTTMPGCTGAMVEWWFGYLETTEQYKWCLGFALVLRIQATPFEEESLFEGRILSVPEPRGSTLLLAGLISVAGTPRLLTRRCS